MNHVHMVFNLVTCVTLAAANTVAHGAEPFHPPPGTYRTSWVGNTFGGDGGPNGFGYWVQDSADEIEVAPDGTVIAGSDWDEAGRCVGLYKDGRPNRVLLKEEGAKRETAWGWNTGNHAVAFDGPNIYVANTGKRLLRFTWTSGDLNSAKFAEDVGLPDVAVGMNVLHGRLVIAYTNRIELRRASGFGVITNFAAPGVSDVAFAPDNSLWIIADNEVRHLAENGQVSLNRLSGVAKPAAIAFDNRGRLIVCDDGPDQQIKFFDVAGASPKLAATFGDRGGLASGQPGESAPTKLYGLRGAGTDDAGNLYVAMGFNGAPAGTLVLRSFTPGGKLRWQVANHSFVDTFGFDPESDGGIVYGRTARFDLDLSQTRPGAEWRQRATTLDAVRFPNDSRADSAMTIYMRHLQGRRLLYGIGQYGGGYRLFAFDGPRSFLAHPVGSVTAPGETWAWDLTAKGDIWHGDAAGKTIRRYHFKGWSRGGQPDYDTNKFESWPWPKDFELVRRVIYDEVADSLYLSGYLKGEAIDSWGVAGKTLRRYDGWRHGSKKLRWTLKLPLNPNSEGPSKPLSPESLALAGDCLFVGMVKPDDGKQHVHILATSDGHYVGSFVPGPEVGGNSGWEDMPYAVNALKRKNGEYLVLVEEDWRGKNLLYRWMPKQE